MLLGWEVCKWIMQYREIDFWNYDASGFQILMASFYPIDYLIKAKEFNLSYDLPISLPDDNGYLIFLRALAQSWTHSFVQSVNIYIYIYIYKSSSCRAASTDIPDPLSPLLPVVHRLWQVFRATPRIFTELLYVCMFKLVVLHLLGHMWGP